MKFKSAILTQASGSIGGMTFSTNRGGLYVRTRAIPTDPNTPAQVTVRAAMGMLVNRWVNTLTPLQRATWDLYAANVPLTGPLGDPITVSGLNMYVRSNVPRVNLGTTIIDVGPAIFNTGALTPTTLSNATEAGQTIDWNFTALDLWNQAGGFGVIYLSRPVSPTINFFRGPYRRSVSLADGNLPAVSPIAAVPPFAFVSGQRLFARVQATFPDGRLTQPQFIGPVTAGA